MDGPVPLNLIEMLLTGPVVTVDDMIRDLSDVYGSGVFDTSATHSAENRRRIAYLFDRGVYDLPDSQRPDCHRLHPHSYKAVYGRMRGDQPSPTITSGFGSTGQGRFVHPHEARTLTPHEAARLQGFPDWFTFGACNRRRALQEMIGNAVPAQLGYLATLAALA
jgi:DNA (cytosine-5)-methyltransferase 1